MSSMTDIRGRVRESADGLRPRRSKDERLREAAQQVGSQAERRRLEAELAAQGKTPPVDPAVGHTTNHGW